MDRQRPSGVLLPNPRRGRFYAKLSLGVLFLILLSGYQPAFQFPPLKKSIVYAEENIQTKTVESQSIPFVFQAPHPGYLTTRFSAYHPGIDLATGLGMPIKPIAKGKVTRVGYTFFGLGLVVEIDHGEGYHSIYAHMGATYVKPDQEVNENDLLGEVGMTGHTSGPHTHLEVYKEGKPIDPLTLLPAQREQPQESDFVAIGGKVSLNPNQDTAQNPTESPQPTETPVINYVQVKPLATPTPAPIKVEVKKPALQINLTPPKSVPPLSKTLVNVLSIK